MKTRHKNLLGWHYWKNCTLEESQELSYGSRLTLLTYLKLNSKWHRMNLVRRWFQSQSVYTRNMEADTFSKALDRVLHVLTQWTPSP